MRAAASNVRISRRSASPLSLSLSHPLRPLVSPLVPALLFHDATPACNRARGARRGDLTPGDASTSILLRGDTTPLRQAAGSSTKRK